MHQEEFEKTGFFNFNRTFKTSEIGLKRDPNKPGSNPTKICFIWYKFYYNFPGK